MSREKLSLGPLPTSKTVKVTIALNAALSDELEQYAALHSKTWQAPVDGPTLIPYIIEQFLRRDRHFNRSKRGPKNTVGPPDPDSVVKVSPKKFQ